MELFTKFELIIMVSVIGFLMFVVLILSIIELICRKRDKKKVEVIETENVSEKEGPVLEVKIEDKEIEHVEVEETKEEVLEEKKEVVVEPSLVKIEANNDNIVIEDIDDFEVPSIEITPFKENIEPLTSELNNKEKAQIELLKIENELASPQTLEDTITNFEAEEEENAIISYQELLSVTQEMKAINLEDVGDEPISITEVYQKFDGNNLEDASVEINSNEDYMLPYNENESLTEIQLENTANLEKLDKEIRKTNKFLHILNELKKNLD